MAGRKERALAASSGAPPHAAARRQTIIECLKHAVTGEWPPNSHAGKSFVHDPKVSPACATGWLPLTRSPLQVYGADDVKAQIKLQCKTVTGKPFLVIRSFQLTRKRASGKYEFKSLDQNIQISNQNGEVRERCTPLRALQPHSARRCSWRG